MTQTKQSILHTPVVDLDPVARALVDDLTFWQWDVGRKREALAYAEEREAEAKERVEAWDREHSS